MVQTLTVMPGVAYHLLDESDPTAIDPSLDLWNPENGPPYSEGFLLRYRAESLKPVLLAAALIALAASVFDLYIFLSNYAPGDRMIGGAHDEPD